MSSAPVAPSCVEQEMERLREETGGLHEQIGKQETEIHKLRAQLGSLREERDRLKRKVSGTKNTVYHSSSWGQIVLGEHMPCTRCQHFPMFLLS